MASPNIRPFPPATENLQRAIAERRQAFNQKMTTALATGADPASVAALRSVEDGIQGAVLRTPEEPTRNSDVVIPRRGDAA